MSIMNLKKIIQEKIYEEAKKNEENIIKKVKSTSQLAKKNPPKSIKEVILTIPVVDTDEFGVWKEYPSRGIIIILIQPTISFNIDSQEINDLFYDGIKIAIELNSNNKINDIKKSPVKKSDNFPKVRIKIDSQEKIEEFLLLEFLQEKLIKKN
ncbi:MAG: hypothetical protein ACOCP8_03345 [archaeon]